MRSQLIYQIIYLLFQLKATAFQNLQIDEQNYKEVKNLTLDNNNLENLPPKLLRMKLNKQLSVKNNQLTSVSFLHCFISIKSS